MISIKPKIERTHPIPKTWREILPKVKVGDSFVLKSIHQFKACEGIARSLGMSLMRRKLDGEGYRIWRKK